MPNLEIQVLKHSQPDVIVRLIDEARSGDTSDDRGIRCPVCAWQPSPASRWTCADCPQPEAFVGGCGQLWNTFDTGGVCPGCSHAWRWTLCLACGSWSRHDDWYEQSD